METMIEFIAVMIEFIAVMIEFIAVMIAFGVCFWLLLKYGD